jgi:hypothetical protein
MDPRRILLIFAVFLLISATISSLGNTQRTERAEKPAPQRVIDPPRELTGELPRQRIVRVREGDLLALTVTADEADTAEIVPLGLQAQVAEGFPGRIEFLATRRGTYPVTLRIAGRAVGRVVVLPPR